MVLKVLLYIGVVITCGQGALLRRRNEAQGTLSAHDSLKPSYQGKQTFGLEMESRCELQSGWMDYLEEDSYGVLALFVRRVLPGNKKRYIGQVELESKGKVESQTYPARNNLEDLTDASCMIYFG